MRPRWLMAAAVALVLVTASCSSSKTASVAAGQGHYKGSGVLAVGSDGSTLLCQQSTLLDDLTSDTTPKAPDCDRFSIPIRGVDVASVPSLQNVGGQSFTSSAVTVTGTWDGTALSATGPVTVAASAPSSPPPSPNLSVPCQAPPTGWPAMPTTLAGYTAAIQALKAYEASHSDTFAGAWAGPDQLTMVEAFTDAPGTHESDLQAIYPRVCVIRGIRTEASLKAIQSELSAGPMPNGNRLITSASELAEDTATGPYVLRVTLLVDDPDVRAWLQDRYGGSVEVDSGILRPA